MKKRHVCPKCRGDKFHTTAHVAQVWEVDGLGNFISAFDNSLEVTHYPNDDNIWKCVGCGIDAIMLDDAAYDGSFEYGGYHFRPYRKFRKGEVHRRLKNDSRTRKMDMQYLMRNMRSDRNLGIASYDWGSCGYYSH